MVISAKILIVDDEPGICQSLLSLLQGHRFDGRIASSGQEAMALLEKYKFDIALVDLFLPDISGRKLMENIKKIGPDIAVIIMTGNASIDSAVKTLRQGAYDYLRKPFDPAELIQTIKNALTQKKLQYEKSAIQKQLSVSQRDYKYLVENSPDIIYMLDPQGRFTFVNPSIKQFLGLDPGQAIGRHYSTVVDKDKAEFCHWIFNERRTGKRARQWNELELLTFDSSKAGDNRVVYAELLSTGIYQTMGGSPKGYIGTHGVIRDITEKKRTALKKKRIKAQLLRAEKIEIVGTLASGVAHDLNNLLSSILGYPELILMDLSKDDPHREYLLEIKKAGDRASEIVKDLLTLARRRLPATEVFSVDNVIADCLTSPEYMDLKTRYPSVAVDLSLNSSGRNMTGSSVHISKCIMNLLLNSAEAMPYGGTITIFTQICLIEKKLKSQSELKSGQYIKLVIADTGTGISKKDMKRIFDPFYTCKKTGRSGTGLGMTIVWTTVKDHLGTIDVKSIEGKGTVMTLYFPVTRKKKKPSLKVDRKDILGHGQSILIIDDILEQRMIASKMIKALGYSTTTVAAGEDGIGIIQTQPVDLVILDMILGNKMDGLEVYRRIKKIRPGQKVIIVSGLSETERIKTALKLGVSQYIKKPYTIDKIGLAIKQVLTGKTVIPEN